VEFIPLAEELGLIGPLGKRVIDLVSRQSAVWRRRFRNDFRISFNISPLQFGSGDLVSDIDTAVDRAQARYGNLEIEITESALMARPETVIAALQAFRDRGLKIAIDDFGTGFSSLSYLRKLPIDVLKVDRTFVSDIGVSENAGALVKAIVSMASALGLKTVAEGVELDTQLAYLNANGCDEVQGYLLAKPMPAADLEDWFDNWEGARLNAEIA